MELGRIPDGQELSELMGAEKYAAWQRVHGVVDALYEMEDMWVKGGKA